MEALVLDASRGAPASGPAEGSSIHLLWFSRPVQADLAELGAQLDPGMSAFAASRGSRLLLGRPCGALRFHNATPSLVAQAAERARSLLPVSLSLELPSWTDLDGLDAALSCALEALEISRASKAATPSHAGPPRI